MSRVRPKHLQVLGALALLAIPLCAYLHFIRWHPEAAFLPGGGEGAWLTYPYVINPSVRAAPGGKPEIFRFARRFRIDRVPEDATLTLRGFRHFEADLNGTPLPIPEHRPQWRDALELPVAPYLVSGQNELEVRVWNGLGVPLLQLSLRGEGLALDSNRTFSVTAEGRPLRRARLANDRLPVPEALQQPTPAQELAKRLPSLAALFVALALLYAFAERRLPAAWAPRIPLMVTCGITGYWLALFVTKLLAMPPYVGFDAGGHIAYIEYIRTHAALPLATDGFSMFHPPLFYALAAGLAGIVGAPMEPAGAATSYRLIPFLAGLGNVWVAYRLGRAVFADDPLRTSLAVVFVGFLPMNLYMSAYVSNEMLSAFLANLAICIAALAMLRPGVSTRVHAALAVCLGLALLSKYTVFLLIPPVLFFLACKLWYLDRRAAAPIARTLAAIVLGILVVAGWYYARNLWHFGEPIVVAWKLEDGREWWHLPSFQTLAFYTSFGEALRHPFLAAFASFWDGFYSTFWGDGMIAGRVGLAGRHTGWNYGFMTVGFLLAAPLTALLGVGVFRALAIALRDPNLHRRIVWSFLLVMVWTPFAALLALAIRYASYAASKAFYLLVVIVPLGLIASLGLAWLPERLAAGRLGVRAVYFGWLGTTIAVFALSFLA